MGDNSIPHNHNFGTTYLFKNKIIIIIIGKKINIVSIACSHFIVWRKVE